MRFTACLQRQHIGFMFKKHWHLFGKRTVLETNAKAGLVARGINIREPKEYVEESAKYYTPVEFPQRFEEIFPDPAKLSLQKDSIHLYGDSNVLVQGTSQAQVLLKTIKFNELPEKIEDSFKKLKIAADVERSMQQSVLVSHLLDAEQQKTVKIVNPLRPMRPYPRNWGITEARKNMLLSTRLLNHCERFQGSTRAADRKIISDAFFVTPFVKEGDQIQLELTAETFMSTRKPIQPFKVNLNPDQDVIPDIFPLKHTVSIPQVHEYKAQLAYPIKSTNQFAHPHTILLHYSDLDVKNIFETPVSEDQFEGRAMLKGFAVAASRAKSLYGANVKELEKPIVVQVVQIESERIQFGIFQLNTLDLDGTAGTKNYWFSKPEMYLYDECCYKEGRPTLNNYNFNVFKLMNVFYSN